MHRLIGWLIIAIIFSILAGDFGGAKEKADRKAALWRIAVFLFGLISGVLLMV